MRALDHPFGMASHADGCRKEAFTREFSLTAHDKRGCFLAAQQSGRIMAAKQPRACSDDATHRPAAEQSPFRDREVPARAATAHCRRATDAFESCCNTQNTHAGCVLGVAGPAQSRDRDILGVSSR